MSATRVVAPRATLHVTTATFVNLCLGLSLAISVLFTQHAGSTNQFHAAGASRRVVLPLLYLLAAMWLVRRGPGRARRGGPVWLWAPAVLCLISLALNLGAFLDDELITNVVQAMLLLCGFTVLGLLGAASGDWSDGERKTFLVVLAVAAVIAVLLPIPTYNLTPYANLVVPTACMALIQAIFGRGHRVRWLLVVLVVMAAGSRALHEAPGQPISIAVEGQLAASAGMIFALAIPRQLRAVGIVVAGVGLVVLLSLPGSRGYLTGHYTGSDVTLAHRAYEAKTVDQDAEETPLGLIIGRGPAATVDLTNSPDRKVLRESGRVLSRVDDVHLITAYLVLKLGLAGLVWLAWLLFVTFRFAWQELTAPRVDLWRVTLVLYVVCGLINAFPAGTELFSNPLDALCLGILWADRRRT